MNDAPQPGPDPAGGRPLPGPPATGPVGPAGWGPAPSTPVPPGQWPPPGTTPAYGYVYPVVVARGTNGMAIAALVCAFLCSPLGIVFGLIAKSQIKRSGEGGDGLATAGIAVGAVFTGLFVLYLVFFFAAFLGLHGVTVLPPSPPP